MLIPRTRSPAAHLEWRIRIFGAGAILALVGMWSEQGWLINIAIGVLLIGLALRFLPSRGATSTEELTDESTDPEDPGSR
jgi:hypothetical protein